MILLFLKFHPSTAFWTLVDSDGYSISSKGFLPTVVDIMVIWVKFPQSSPFEFADSSNVDVHSCHLLFDHCQFALFYGPNIPDSYAILLFTALYFTSITSYICNSMLFLLWLYLFILSGVTDEVKWSEVAQLCLTLCDPMNCCLPSSSVHGIVQAIVLEWGAMSFSRISSLPRDRTWISLIVDRRFTIWATREVLVGHCWLDRKEHTSELQSRE